MHQLSATLLSAQRDSTALPHIAVSLAERWGGVTQLRWERVYNGQEPDGAHAAIVSSSSGALIRVRVQTDPAALLVQRAASPGPDAQFSAWQSLGAASAKAGVAVTEIDGEIRVYDVAPDQRSIRERSSADDGVTFGSPRSIATSTLSIGAIAAAAAPGGAALIVYADSSGGVSAMMRTGGTWSSPGKWTNSLSSVDGIACASVDSAWAVVLCGTAADGASGVWTCALSGASPAVAVWSTLHEVIASSAGSGVTYAQPGLCIADGLRMSFVEAYGGANGYAQTLTTHPPASARFADHRWREPIPFGPASGVGPALTADASHVWLTTPSGVWRAQLSPSRVDVSDAVILADLRETPRGASLTLHLAEERMPAALLSDAAGPLGQEISLAWGYQTGAGKETGQAQRYWAREARRETLRGSPVTVLEAEDAWWFLAAMRARRQLTWPAQTASVWQILSRLLTMAGLSASQTLSSPAIVATYPPVTISPNESLAAAVHSLMARVPDLTRFSDGVLEAVHARETDAPVYRYGGAGEHAVLNAVRSSTLSRVNHVQVYGDGAIGQALNQSELERVGNLLVQVTDRSLTTESAAARRAETELRARAAREPLACISVPVNAGQQLHDVVSVTAPGVGWKQERLRVAALRTRYDIGGGRAVYRQDIDLISGV